MDERATVCVDGIAEKAIGRNLSQRRGVMEVADDLAAEAPEVVDVSANGFSGKPRRRQVLYEGPETNQQLFAWREVFIDAHP